MLKKIIFIVIILVCNFSFLKIYAAEFEAGETINVSDNFKDDLYIAGGFISTNVKTVGDIVVAGGTVFMNDSIGEDLLCAGGDVFVNSNIGDDIRIAGANIKVLKAIGGDAVVAGGNVFFGEQSEICGDLVVLAGEVTCNGTINGDLIVKGGSCTFNGEVLGKSKIQCAEMVLNGKFKGPASLAAEKIKIKPPTAFYNKIEYWTEDKAQHINWEPYLKNDTKAVLNEDLYFDELDWELTPAMLGLSFISLSVVMLLSAALVILLFIFLTRRFFFYSGKQIFDNFFKSTGIGVIYLIVVPVTAVFLMLIIIGIPIGILLMSVYIFMLLTAHAFTATVFAFGINEKYNKSWGYQKLFWLALALDVVLKLMLFIPIVGILISLVGFMAATGAFLLGLSSYKNLHHPKGYQQS